MKRAYGLQSGRPGAGAVSLFAALSLTVLTNGTPAQEDAAPSTVWAPVVASWIAEFRDDAIERGVAPAPPEIREALNDFVPTRVLDEVRWRVDGTTTIVGRALFRLGSARAITLDNVILFAGIDEAADATLWSHELYHVMQYREWGIEGFATRYIADNRAVEHEAKEFSYRWWKASRLLNHSKDRE